MTIIYLPENPTEGQEYVAINGATYIWLGNRWNTSVPIQNRSAVYYYEGGDAFTWDTAGQVNIGDNLLDGGTSLT
mgnify:FL=1